MSLHPFATVGLAELNATAELLHRVDRKYLLTPAAARALLCLLPPGTRSLEIDGRQSFRYSSVYFDTIARDSYLLAARGRRHRFKVRLRHYCDSGEVFLEVKTCRHGMIVKQRIRHTGDSPSRLDPGQYDFISSCLASAGVRGIRPQWLLPSLETNYTRTTLLSPDGRTRITLDRDLSWTEQGRTLHRPDLSIVETKSSSSPGPVDRTLWRSGHRPRRFSKYVAGLATFHPDLPSNRWHTTLLHHF